MLGSLKPTAYRHKKEMRSDFLIPLSLSLIQMKGTHANAATDIGELLNVLSFLFCQHNRFPDSPVCLVHPL
jgi:hypothetical protein